MSSIAFRYAARGFRRSPGILALVAFALALGIGGTTAVFGVIDGLLINPLRDADSRHLAEVWTEQAPGKSAIPGLSREAIAALRRQSQVFLAVEAYQFGAATITGDGDPALVSGPRVTPGLLRMFGAVPRVGRLFVEGDATPGEHVALISEALWASRFGKSDDILGRRLWVDGEPHTIVGVLPTGFAIPERNAQVWRPLALDAQATRTRNQTVIRFRPALTRDAVSSQLSAISASLRDGAILPRDRRLVLADLIQQRYGRQYATALYVMLGAMSLVLLIACANVTHVLLARGASRQAEFALMGALGAKRSQVIIHVLGESLCLAALGGIGGVVVARLLLTTLLDMLPPQMSMLSAVTDLDWRAVSVAIGLSTLTCLIVGTLPALRAAGVDVIDGLNLGARGTRDRSHERWQSTLVVAQLAMVLVLLTGTGLLLRSFVRLVNVEPGFDPDNLLVFDIQMPEGRYQAPGAALMLFEDLARLVSTVPGVTAVTFSEGAPPGGGGFSFDIHPEAEGRPRVEATGLELPHPTVAPDYFSTMGIPLLAGHAFARNDGNDVVIVNDVLARRFWGNQSPLGRRFRLDPDQRWLTVVGVAADVKQMGLNDPMGDGMEIYYPYSRNGRSSFFTLIIRTAQDQASIVQHVKQRLATLDRDLPIIAARTMEQRLFESVARPRFFLRLASAFATIALLLAGVGVYGTATYWVTRRRRELGIRMALGATRGSVIALVVGRSARLAAWGSAIGIALSFLVATMLNSLLFETSAWDPITLITVVPLLTGLVLAACYLPARRASGVDPAVVLRAE